MNRREFVKFLALIAAGAAARPEQIAAFEHYYNMNSPLTGESMIAIDEIMLSGLATKPAAVAFDLFQGPERRLPVGFNAYGGVLLWRAGPDQKIVGAIEDFKWKLEPIDWGGGELDDNWIRRSMRGHISYIDQIGMRQNKFIQARAGRLGGDR